MDSFLAEDLITYNKSDLEAVCDNTFLKNHLERVGRLKAGEECFAVDEILGQGSEDDGQSEEDDDSVVPLR